MSHAATPEGTSAFASRHVGRGALPGAWSLLGNTGLKVSRVGVGCYRIDDSNARHAVSLAKALRAGVNLIDTSTNYTDGGSESCVGRVLGELIGSEELRRDEIVVVSKVGYVQGGNLELAQRAMREGRPYAEMVKYADGCWHCIHPEWISDQLTRSLERLKLDRLDAWLLHNPEYFLADAHHRGGVGGLDVIRAEFYRRIRAAFHRLEEEADAGRLSWYGVSSNTFVSAAHDVEATSLSTMMTIAREVAVERTGNPDSHRFAVIQLPLNLLETGAVTERNNGVGCTRTVMEEARHFGLGVLVNRPLNAFVDGGLKRLADFPDQAPGIDVQRASADVLALEEEFRLRIAPALDSESGAPASDKLFGWGGELSAGWARFSNLDHWRQAEDHFIRPRLEHLLEHFSLHLAGRVRNDWAAWRLRYEPAIDLLLAAVGDYHRKQAQAASNAVAFRLDPLLPEEWRDESLSRKSLAVLAATPGVSSVLMGLRRPEYVDDAALLFTRTLPSFDLASWSAS